MRAFDIERKAKLMQAKLVAHVLIGFDHGELVDRAARVLGKIDIDIVGEGNGVERLVEDCVATFFTYTPDPRLRETRPRFSSSFLHN